MQYANNVINFLFLIFNGFNSSKPLKNVTVISDYGIYPCVHSLIIKEVLYCVALLYLLKWKLMDLV